MSDWTFDVSWPILRPDWPLNQLVGEALCRFLGMAAEQRVELLADPVWSIVGGRMRVQAPGVRPRSEQMPSRATRAAKIQAHIDDIRRWAEDEGLTDRQIIALLLEQHGITCDRTAIYKARRRNGIAAGTRDFPPASGSGSVAAETAVSVVEDGTATDPSITELAVAA